MTKLAFSITKANALHLRAQEMKPSQASQETGIERYVLSWTGHDGYSFYGEKWRNELTDAIDKGIYADAEIYRFDELSDFFIQNFKSQQILMHTLSISAKIQVLQLRSTV